MGRIHVGAVALGLASLLIGGCQNKLHEENLKLHADNRELQARLTDAEMRLRTMPDPNEAAAMRAQLAERETRIRELEQQLRDSQPASAGAANIAGIETRYDANAGTMTVTLPGDVLFESGQATLKQSAKATLDKVADALKRDYAGRPIYIDGHTDADPINRTRDKWADNWDLSAARARAVLLHLKDRGISEKNMVLRAYGPHKPKSPTNKAANRRVEIVVAVR